MLWSEDGAKVTRRGSGNDMTMRNRRKLERLWRDMLGEDLGQCCTQCKECQNGAACFFWLLLEIHRPTRRYGGSQRYPERGPKGLCTVQDISFCFLQFVHTSTRGTHGFGFDKEHAKMDSGCHGGKEGHQRTS